jgi:hypothetical protein
MMQKQTVDVKREKVMLNRLGVRKCVLRRRSGETSHHREKKKKREAVANGEANGEGMEREVENGGLREYR